MSGRPMRVLVTGAASGIGLGIARHFAERGHAVWLSDCDAGAVGQAAAAELGQQRDAVGLDLLDLPRATGDQLVGPAVGRLLDHEADLPLLQLAAQQGRIDHLELGLHHLHQQAFQAPPHGALLLLAVQVPVHHLVVETLAATAHQVAVDRGAEADAGGLDALLGHGGSGLARETGRHVSPLSKPGHLPPTGSLA